MSAESLIFPDSMSQEEREEVQEWFDSRPEVIKEMIRKYSPWNKFLMPPHKDYYTIEGYSEDGTVRVVRWDHRTNEPRWQVFGVNPNTLVLRNSEASSQDFGD